MHNVNFANRFGLVASFFVVSLFPSTSAWAQKTAAASGTQQVVVTNTPAQPVPMVGLVKDSDNPARKPFQWHGSVWMEINGALNAGVTVTTVPANQRLVIQHISGWCPSMLANVTATEWQTNNTYQTLWFPPEFANGSPLPASSPVTFYTEPGAQLSISVNLINPVNVQRFCELSMTGYYIDLP